MTQGRHRVTHWPLKSKVAMCAYLTLHKFVIDESIMHVKRRKEIVSIIDSEFAVYGFTACSIANSEPVPCKVRILRLMLGKRPRMKPPVVGHETLDHLPNRLIDMEEIPPQ